MSKIICKYHKYDNHCYKGNKNGNSLNCRKARRAILKDKFLKERKKGGD